MSDVADPRFVLPAVDAVLEWWLTGTTDDAVLEWWASDDALETAEALVVVIVQAIESAGFEISHMRGPSRMPRIWATTPNPSREQPGFLRWRRKGGSR